VAEGDVVVVRSTRLEDALHPILWVVLVVGNRHHKETSNHNESNLELLCVDVKLRNEAAHLQQRKGRQTGVYVLDEVVVKYTIDLFHHCVKVLGEESCLSIRSQVVKNILQLSVLELVLATLFVERPSTTLDISTCRFEPKGFGDNLTHQKDIGEVVHPSRTSPLPDEWEGAKYSGGTRPVCEK